MFIPAGRRAGDHHRVPAHGGGGHCGLRAGANLSINRLYAGFYPSISCALLELMNSCVVVGIVGYVQVRAWWLFGQSFSSSSGLYGLKLRCGGGHRGLLLTIL